jgi:hypothetical protein
MTVSNAPVDVAARVTPANGDANRGFDHVLCEAKVAPAHPLRMNATRGR